MSTITIVIKNGLIETIYADTNPRAIIAIDQVIVIDKDTEGSDPNDSRLCADRAYVYTESVQPHCMMAADEVAALQACPLEAAKAATPFWMRDIQNYDGLETHPVREEKGDEKSGVTGFCEVCAPEEAHFWSVYGHLKEGGVMCFEDFDTEAEAKAFAEKLLNAYSHLQENGI